MLSINTISTIDLKAKPLASEGKTKKFLPVKERLKNNFPGRNKHSFIQYTYSFSKI